MTFMVQFHVDGPVVPKARPRMTRKGVMYSDLKTVHYEAKIRNEAVRVMANSEPLETPVAVYLYFRLPVPESYSKKRLEACLSGFETPTKKPDIDNLAKSVLDGMNGTIFLDDKQVVSLHLKKVYATEPGVDILVTEELP